MISHTPSFPADLMSSHPLNRFAFCNTWQQTMHGTPTFSEAASGGYRALVVDGDAAMQTSLKSHLAALERMAAVDFADDGNAALEKVGVTQYDLIFLCVTMRGLDGYEICAQLRKMPAYKKTPIVMMTDRVSPADAMRGVKAGCTTYLAKPLRQEALQNLSRRVLA